MGTMGDSSTWDDSLKVQPGDGSEAGDGAYKKPHVGLDPHRGAVFTVAGNSGRITGGDLDHPAMLVSYNLLGSVVLDVNGSRLDSRFIDTSGNVIDDFTMLKGPFVPVAAFDADPVLGRVPLTVDFTDHSEDYPTDWSWDFDDDGAADSSAPSPVHTYMEAGLYSVRLTVDNAAGTDAMIREDYICAHSGSPGQVTDVQFVSGGSELSWDAQGDAVNYDVVRGELNALRDTAGNFRASNLICLGENLSLAMASDPEVPASMQAFFYLARATNCAGTTGTYEVIGGQVGSRDSQLQGVLEACACDPSDDPDLDHYCERAG